MRALLTAALALGALHGLSSATPLSEHFTSQDAQSYEARARAVLKAESSSVADRAYSIQLLEDLGVDLPGRETGGPCEAAARALQSPRSLPELHYAAEVAKAFGCEDSAAPAEVVAAARRASESLVLQESYHGLLALRALGESIDASRVVGRLVALVDDDGSARSTPESEDASVTNAALISELLARLGKDAGADRASAIKSAVSKMMEAALSEKSSAADAIFLLGPLAAAAGGALPASVRARLLKSVAAHLLAARHSVDLLAMSRVYQGLKAIAAHPKSPLCVALSPAIASADDLSAGKVALYTLDLFGRPAEVRSPAVVAATRTDGGSASNLSAESPLKADGAGRWKLALSELEAGQYALELRVLLGASSEEEGKPTTATLPLVVTSPAQIGDVSVTVSRSKTPGSGGSGAEYAPPLPADAAADAVAGEHVHVCFVVAGAGVTKPHQAMVRFEHEKTGLEAFFVALPQKGAAGKHCADADLAREMDTFLQRTGPYKVSILVADPAIHPALQQPLGSLSLRFPPKAPQHWPLYARPILYESDNTLTKLPEKHHTFRLPEKRPPIVLSAVFALLVFVPLACFLAALPRLGWSRQSLPSGGSSLGYCAAYQACVGAILLLFAWYWLELTMVSTLTMLAPLLVVTGAAGRMALVQLASEKRAAAAAGKKD